MKSHHLDTLHHRDLGTPRDDRERPRRCSRCDRVFAENENPAMRFFEEGYLFIFCDACVLTLWDLGIIKEGN